jgi:transcription elongation GreA/GreB family factor
MSYETLYGMLPGYAGIANLASRAQEINQALAQEQIAPEEHAALLEDLVRTQVIVDEAQYHEQKLFANQLIKVLASLPMPN